MKIETENHAIRIHQGTECIGIELNEKQGTVWIWATDKAGARGLLKLQFDDDEVRQVEQ